MILVLGRYFVHPLHHLEKKTTNPSTSKKAPPHVFIWKLRKFPKQASQTATEYILVGGFNPFEKYARQIGSSPKVGVKITKYLSCHHLASEYRYSYLHLVDS